MSIELVDRGPDQANERVDEVGPARADLRAIAQRNGAAVRSANVRIQGLKGGPFTDACQLSHHGVGVRLRANDDWLVVEVERETSLCFAGPVADAIVGADRAFGEFDGMPIFISGWFGGIDRLERWLTDHVARLGGLIGADGERFLVAKNQSMFALRPLGVDADLDRLDKVVSIIKMLPPGDTSDGSPTEVPDVLGPLLPTIETWALSDDDARGELIERSSDEELETLVRTVTPHLREIDRYADAHPDAAGALLTGDLAQAAIEAQHELKRRSDATRD